MFFKGEEKKRAIKVVCPRMMVGVDGIQLMTGIYMKPSANNEIELSIVYITFHRPEQLRAALVSCLKCVLPENTEFVVVDNGSDDETEAAVKSVFVESGFRYIYHRTEKNLGVGGGRNLGYALSRGRYVYCGDDDAVIDWENCQQFFVRAIDLMEENSKVATVATQIYDECWQANRLEVCGPQVGEGIYECFMFCGGSHFLRREYFGTSPYLANEYGYEELPPSLEVAAKGYINVFYPDLLAIHQPKCNKWDFSKDENRKILINECSTLYAIKKNMFPKIVIPAVWFAFLMRCWRHLKNKSEREQAKVLAGNIEERYEIGKRISLASFTVLLRKFGLRIL